MKSLTMCSGCGIRAVWHEAEGLCGRCYDERDHRRVAAVSITLNNGATYTMQLGPVAQAALKLADERDTFTTDDVVKATGYDPASVRSKLHQLAVKYRFVHRIARGVFSRFPPDHFDVLPPDRDRPAFRRAFAFAYLTEHSTITSAEFAQAAGITRLHAQGLLRRFAARGHLERIERGVYKRP